MRAFGLPLVARQTPKKHRRGNPAYILGLLLLLCGVSWYGWRTYNDMQIRQVAGVVEQTIRRSFRPGDVVVEVVPDRSKRRITVTGMGFGPGGAGQIGRRVRALAAPYTLDFNLVVRDLDGARLERDALAASLSDAQSALAQSRTELGQLKAALAGANHASLTDPQDALRDWTRDYAVFFASGTDFRGPAFAERQLDDLARLMADAPAARLRIEGYTDGDNRIPANARIAKARALVVAEALRARGIAPRRLIPIGGHRADPAISDATGPDSPNHRVAFSLAFAGE